MAYREHPIGTLIRKEPKTAFTELKKALVSKRINGNVALLADKYEVDYRTASRWIDRLELAGYSLREIIQTAKADAKARGVRLYRKLSSDDKR